MPSRIHDSVQYAIQDITVNMLATNFLSLNQYMRLKIGVGTGEFSSFLPTCYSEPCVLIIDM